MKYIFLFICVVQLISCKSEDQIITEQITATVQALKDNEQKRAFLESIFDKHIDMRLKETKAWNQFGRGSDEYESLVSDHRSEDLILAEKIDIYMNTYGYPSIMQLGQKSAVIAIAHLTYVDDIYMLRDNFNYFFDAYKFNDITDDLFYDYLIKLLKTPAQERRQLSLDYKDQTEIIQVLIEQAQEKINK